MSTELLDLPDLPAGSLSAARTVVAVPGVGGAPATPYKAPLSAAVSMPGGITSAVINDSGHLVLTKTDGTTQDLGAVVGAPGPLGPLGPIGPAGPIGSFSGTAPITVDASVISLAQSGATAGQVLSWSGTAWAPATIPATSNGDTSPAITGKTIDGTTAPATTSAPYQMVTADRVIDVNKTTGAATKILLPTAPTLWVDYTIIDGKGDAGTNNITIAAPSGVKINGAATFVLNGNNFAVTLRAVNATTWRLT